FERRKRILILLNRPEFSRRRPFYHGARKDLVFGVAQFAQFVNPGLEQIRDRREPAAHVAVKRAVTGRVLTLVSGGEQQGTLAIRDRHENHAAQASLKILVHHAELERRFESSVENAEKRLISGVDRKIQTANAE